MQDYCAMLVDMLRGKGCSPDDFCDSWIGVFEERLDRESDVVFGPVERSLLLQLQEEVDDFIAWIFPEGRPIDFVKMMRDEVLHGIVVGVSGEHEEVNLFRMLLDQVGHGGVVRVFRKHSPTEIKHEDLFFEVLVQIGESIIMIIIMFVQCRKEDGGR